MRFKNDVERKAWAKFLFGLTAMREQDDGDRRGYLLDCAEEADLLIKEMRRRTP